MWVGSCFRSWSCLPSACPTRPTLQCWDTFRFFVVGGGTDGMRNGPEKPLYSCLSSSLERLPKILAGLGMGATGDGDGCAACSISPYSRLLLCKSAGLIVVHKAIALVPTHLEHANAACTCGMPRIRNLLLLRRDICNPCQSALHVQGTPKRASDGNSGEPRRACPVGPEVWPQRATLLSKTQP